MSVPAYRPIVRRVRGQAASDGAGVRLTRIIGSNQLPDLDPFLLLDEFGSDKPGDYIAGFPSHPHRGFETVTYMLDGRMRHKDNHGNEGLMTPGSVQWMTAGRGIVHSEMPEQESGLMRGFQLWVNLPAKDKMTAPQYQEFPAERIPEAQPSEGVRVKVAGLAQLHQPPARYRNPADVCYHGLNVNETEGNRQLCAYGYGHRLSSLFLLICVRLPLP